MNELVKEERRASKAGYHFINLYQQCPRRWWIHYGLGLVPTRVHKALIFGKAWHEALEVIYKTQSLEEALNKGLSEIERCRSEYINSEDITTDQEKMKKLLPLWKIWFLNLAKEYKVLEVETEYEATLASGAKMTFRPDAILQRITDGSIFIAEHKSTSYSVDNMSHTVDSQDQATAYIWGLRKARPDWAPKVCGILLDIAYARTYKGKVSDTCLIDSRVINRTERDLAEFEISTAGLFAELGSKYLAWKSGKYPVPLIFPRNGTTCSLFGCEYENICRTTLAPGVPIGDDYELDPLIGKDEDVLRSLAEHDPRS